MVIQDHNKAKERKDRETVEKEKKTDKEELVIANLLCSFDWKLPPGMVREDIDLEVFPGITQHKKNHLCLCVKTRIIT